jgi:hypothetical protein
MTPEEFLLKLLGYTKVRMVPEGVVGYKNGTRYCYNPWLLFAELFDRADNLDKHRLSVSLNYYRHVGRALAEHANFKGWKEG